MNCVTTSISSGSDFPIHGTLAVSTSALLRYTTTCGERLQNVCSGCQLRADAGGSTSAQLRRFAAASICWDNWHSMVQWGVKCKEHNLGTRSSLSPPCKKP